MVDQRANDIQQKLFVYMQENAGRAVTFKELEDNLQYNHKQVSNGMYRLAANELVTRLQRGIYTVAEQHMPKLPVHEAKAEVVGIHDRQTEMIKSALRQYAAEDTEPFVPKPKSDIMLIQVIQDDGDRRLVLDEDNQAWVLRKLGRY